MASLSDITVAISTNISNFQKGLDRAQRRLQKAGKGFKEAGTTMSQSLTLPLAAAGAGAVKAASDFEDAVAEIRKVSDQETASKLAGQIRQMATEIPLAQSEIANLAADAARFGVSGSKNIQQFTKTVAQMSFTTDLSAQEAGRSLAKIADQTDTPISEIDRLGSTIVKLGDNMATSQNEIVKAMSRGAIAARNFGLSGQEIAGLSARINEVSESSERAGTRLRRVFQELANPKTVEKVAQALDMTASEFKALRDSSPQKALTAVVEKISQGGAEGKKMANIFATSSRAALRGLASDTQALNEALGMARNEFKANGELSRQAAIQQQKFSNQLQLALNRLRNVAITIGNKLMPFVLDLVNAIQRGISAFSSLSSRMQGIIIVGAGIAAALGPVLFIFGFFVSSVLPGLISALSAVAGAFGVLFSPIGAIGAALAGAAALIIQNWNEVKQFFQALGITDALQALLSITKKVVQGVIGATVMLFNKVSSALNGTGDSFAQAGKFIKNALTALFQNIKRIFNAVIDAAFLLFQALKHEFQLIQAIFQGDMDKALKHLEGMFSSVFLGIIKLISSTVKFILTRIQNLASALGPLGDKMADGIGSIKDSINQNVSSLKDKFGLDETEKKMEDNQKAAKDMGSEMVKQGKRITGSLSIPSLGGGGAGGSGDGDSSLSKVTDGGGGGTGPSKAKTVPDGALENVKGFATLQDKAAQSTKKLNKSMARQAERQRRNAVINQQAGQIIGRTMKRTTQQLTKTFSAALVGTQSLSKGMAAFGDFMQKMFQKLIQKVIQLIIKMTILKALQTAIGGGLGGGLGGGAIGGVMKGLTGGMSGMFGGGGSGGGGSMNISGSLKGDDINLAGQRAQGANNRINGAGIN